MTTAAAAAKLLQSCLTLCDPIDGGPPGSLSLGFSRQEHWSGLPFPSPRHESEKWKWSHSVVSDSSQHHGLQPTRLLRPWDFPGKSTGVECHCRLRKTNNSFYKLSRILFLKFSLFLTITIQWWRFCIPLEFGATALICVKVPAVLLAFAFVPSVQVSAQWKMQLIL